MPDKTPEEQQQAFAAVLDQAMREALAGVEYTNTLLEKERAQLAQELEAARAARKEAEEQGARIAAEFFAKHSEELTEIAKRELLHELIRRHLKDGKPVEEICAWLDSDPAFVHKIASALSMSTKSMMPDLLHNTSPRLHYHTSGRGGTLRFENQHTSFDMWWEFAGGNALAIIAIPSTQEWEATTGIPLAQRDEVLQFIGMQVVLDQTSGRGSVIYDDQFMTVYGG